MVIVGLEAMDNTERNSDSAPGEILLGSRTWPSSHSFLTFS